MSDQHHAAEGWLRIVACADLFLDELEMAAGISPGVEVARRFSGMLKAGVLEIVEDGDDSDDDDDTIREITLPKALAVTLLLEGAVEAVRNGAAEDSAVVKKALGPLRNELLMASNPAPPPPTMAAKTLALANLAAASMGANDSHALRNAFGERLQTDEKRTIVTKSAEAGMSSDGQSVLMSSWASADDHQGTTSASGHPAKLVDAMSTLQESDKQVMSGIVDTAAYEAIVSEELASRQRNGSSGAGKAGLQPGAPSLLQLAMAEGASAEAVRAIATGLMQVTAVEGAAELTGASTPRGNAVANAATPRGSAATPGGSTGTPGGSAATPRGDAAPATPRSNAATPRGKWQVAGAAVAKQKEEAKAANAALTERLKGVTISQDLLEAKEGAAKKEAAVKAAALKWQAAAQEKKAELSGQNAELKKRLSQVKSRLF